MSVYKLAINVSKKELYELIRRWQVSMDIAEERHAEICQAERENRLVVLPSPLTTSDMEVIKNVGRLCNNLDFMQKIKEQAKEGEK